MSGIHTGLYLQPGLFMYLIHSSVKSPVKSKYGPTLYAMISSLFMS
ncbi:hypothetical protein D322_588 [Yersinia enterocolitica IP 10393]|uniref:Uncharacterized protein n=1 Tax=Yersinia enterocolitica W22703 TaxID=913028 RepID=F4N014_YEREN|nr:unknown protein [Yersinia enterocolitica W22703]CCO67484.1 hypothetical protein D322_588 [Yersinia enterocolitica IP 10393]